MGTLYICPTPIGNLEDITFRTVRILKEVDLIAAEDTRHSLKLLNYLGVKKPLTSYHEHNKLEKGPTLIEKVINGENIALISDAGMPGISDPGEDLIKKAIEAGIEIEVLPGATASITALVLSGFSTKAFIFEGFLGTKRKNKVEKLKELKNEKRTIILYETPHKIKNTLEDIHEILKDRKIALIRELTKKFQEVQRGTAKSLLEYYNNKDIRGEIVLILDKIDIEEEIKEIDILKELSNLIKTGHTTKEAIKIVSKEFDVPKNIVYKESIRLTKS